MNMCRETQIGTLLWDNADDYMIFFILFLLIEDIYLSYLFGILVLFYFYGSTLLCCVTLFFQYCVIGNIP